MENFKNHYKKYIFHNRKNYLVEIVSATDSENDFLDNIAEKISNEADILLIKNEGMPDGKFLGLCKKIKLLCAEFDVIFLISQRADIAFLAEADGIHLEPDGLDIHSAKEILGENAIIGISANNEQQVQTAIENCADYILAYFDINKSCPICCFRNGNPIKKLS